MFNGEMIVIKRGQYLTSMVKLAEKWMWNRKTVSSYLNMLEKEQMITKSTDNKKTLITIENYEIYQCDEKENGQQDGQQITQQNGQSTDSRTDTNNNVKNDNNVKNINNRAFVKPTIDEVRAYCAERNNNVDAESFVDFYDSKGWMVGKNKMKDWKAAVRTWEKSRGGSKPSNYKQTTNNDLNPQITAQLRALEEQQLASMPDIDSMSDEDIDRLIRGEL